MYKSLRNTACAVASFLRRVMVGSGPALNLSISRLASATAGFTSRTGGGVGGYAQAALKQDLADAMATCEELDQTVTDLTDDLYAKVLQYFCYFTSLLLHGGKSLDGMSI